MKIQKEQRVKIRGLARKWALAERAASKFSESMEDTPEHNAKEQRLNQRVVNAEDRMYRAVMHLPLSASDDDELGHLVTACAAGIVAEHGYDPDSLYDWVALIEGDAIDDILGEEEDKDA